MGRTQTDEGNFFEREGKPIADSTRDASSCDRCPELLALIGRASAGLDNTSYPRTTVRMCTTCCPRAELSLTGCVLIPRKPDALIGRIAGKRRNF